MNFQRIQKSQECHFLYLNINSVRNKFDNLKLIGEDVDILCVVETKIDNSFPTSVGLDIISPIL